MSLRNDGKLRPRRRAGRPVHTRRVTFVVRIDVTEGEGGSSQWRGQVQHLQTGAQAYFTTAEQLGEWVRRWSREAAGAPGNE